MPTLKPTMAKKNETKQSEKRSGVGFGVGLTAAAVAAAGAYFLYGSKNATKNRKAVKSWALKAKADVLETLESAQEMSKKEYEQLVDRVGAAYAHLQDVKKTDLADFKREMKQHWESIAKEAKKASKEARTQVAGKPQQVAKKATKKAATKAVKKTTKKATGDA